MNYLIDLEHIKHKCRICLLPSNQMISLNCKLELDEQNIESSNIADALENIFSIKVEFDPGYPEGVCITCYKNIKISYGLKTKFIESQLLLERCTALLKLRQSVNSNDFEGSEIIDHSLDEDDKHILEVYSDIDIKEHHLDESALNDFVILQVTNDTDDEGAFKTEIEDGEQDVEINKSESEQAVESLDLSQCIVEKDSSESELNETDIDNNETTVEPEDPNEYIIEQVIPKSKTSYQCPFCNERYLNRTSLQQHKIVCQKHNLLKCEHCTEQFSSVMSKQVHIKTKHKCPICNEILPNLKSRPYHIKTKHSMKKFVCKICDKAFHFKTGLETHMDTHSKDKFKEICPECGKGFHYRGGLFYHMKIHRGERNYLCDYCDARFLNISGLKKHILTHTGEKPCQCSYCGKSFRSSSILSKHEKTHTGQRPHSCAYCGKGFISLYNLKLHIAGHRGSCPCEFCEKSFLNEEVLKLHMKFKHGIKNYFLGKEESE